MRLFEKPPRQNDTSQQVSPTGSRFRFGNRSPSMIDESKNPLIPDSHASNFIKSSSRGQVQTKANTNTNRIQSSNHQSPGYKGMDGKTYKSFLEYRKNSEKRLQEMSSINNDKLMEIKESLGSNHKSRLPNSRQPFLPDIN